VDGLWCWRSARWESGAATGSLAKVVEREHVGCGDQWLDLLVMVKVRVKVSQGFEMFRWCCSSWIDHAVTAHLSKQAACLEMLTYASLSCIFTNLKSKELVALRHDYKTTPQNMYNTVSYSTECLFLRAHILRSQICDSCCVRKEPNLEAEVRVKCSWGQDS
jgi:hypothetical protein